jgi:hypothetical protein
LLGQNQPAAARDCWRIARAIAEEMGSRRWLWQILPALSQIESDPASASLLGQKAREIISYMAEHTPPDFRSSFLGLPKVQSALTA